MALLQRARNDSRKKKRLAEKNLASNLTQSSSAIVSGLFPAPRVNPSPVSVLSSSLSNFDEDTMSPTVVIPNRAVLPQNRSSFRSVPAPAVEKPSSRKGFRYGSSVFLDQLKQETFGPYGSKYGLSSRYVTKIPVDLDVLQELCDLRSTVGKPSDIANINHWRIRLLAESIDLLLSRFGIRSFFDEPEQQQSSSSSTQVRCVIGDSYHKDATYVDTSSLLLHQGDDDDDDENINVYNEDPPADYVPMVEEEQEV